MFDLAEEGSVERCDYYLNKALEEGIHKECIFLVGNKKDVEHGEPEKAREMAKRYEVQYEECSAKENEGVVELFNKLAGHLAKLHGDSP